MQHTITISRTVTTFCGLTAALAIFGLTGACDMEEPEDHARLEAELELEDELADELAGAAELEDDEALDDDEAMEDAVLVVDLALPSSEPGIDVPDVGLMAEPDVEGYVWRPWISEETPPATCSSGQIVTGVDCSGPYCDNVQIECHGFGGAHGTRTWSSWFWENSGRECSGKGYITGLACKDSYCDKIKVQCGSTNLGKSNCSWTGWYSEEQPPYLAPAGKAIAGIQCNGNHCDNKSYKVCSV